MTRAHRAAPKVAPNSRVTAVAAQIAAAAAANPFAAGGSSAGAAAGSSSAGGDSAVAAGNPFAAPAVASWRIAGPGTTLRRERVDLGDLAKPALMARNVAAKLMARSPLDVALADALRARDESMRAMADGEINLNKMYARDHDGMVTARALLVGANKALKKLMAATEALEAHAAAARAKLLSDQAALRGASAASIEALNGQRNMLLATLLAELEHMETDSSFSLSCLSSRLQQTEASRAALDRKLRGEISLLTAQLAELTAQHADHTAAAESTEAKLSGEVARLCGLVAQLKADAERAAKEAAGMHAQVVRAMSEELAAKQRTIEARDATIAAQIEQLHGTSATLVRGAARGAPEPPSHRLSPPPRASDPLARARRAACAHPLPRPSRGSQNGQLRNLEREKAEREQQLLQEKEGAVQEGKRKERELGTRLGRLQAEQELKERRLANELAKTQAEGTKQAEGLKSKIEKMRKLQELALGGVASADGAVKPSPGKAPSPRGRQLLYHESMKAKDRERSSISPRDQDVGAPEALGLDRKGVACEASPPS